MAMVTATLKLNMAAKYGVPMCEAALQMKPAKLVGEVDEVNKMVKL